jgi:hypothetical protein
MLVGMIDWQPTAGELAALKTARGGRSTDFGTAEHELFEAMAERGLVKEVTFTGTGIAWRLSGQGLELAYAD